MEKANRETEVRIQNESKTGVSKPQESGLGGWRDKKVLECEPGMPYQGIWT